MRFEKMLDFKRLTSIVVLMMLTTFPLLSTNAYILHLMIISMVWAVVAMNWNLTLGYAGLFHVAQFFLFTIGAYSSALLTVNFGLSPWLGLIVGGIFALAASIAIGLTTTRISDIYLVLLTFALHFLLRSIIVYFRDVTGGTMGLRVPTFSLGPLVFTKSNLTPYYYVGLIIFICSTILIRKVTKSHIGMALNAIRDSEDHAKCSGIDPSKYKVLAFMIGSVFTGVTGAFYGYYLLIVSPEILAFSNLLSTLAMIVIGGTGTLYGPIMGSFALTFLGEYLRTLEIYKNIIYGLIIVLILIFEPRGIVGIIEVISRRARNAFALLKVRSEEK